MSTSGLPLSYVNALNIGKQSRSAAIGLLFYDHLLSLDREVEFVWTADKKRPAFWLYIFVSTPVFASPGLSANSWQNRFFALAYYIFDTIPITPAGRTPSNAGTSCVIYLMCDAIVTTLSTLAVQVVLQLRIYALYERNRRILILLVTLCSLEVVAMAVLVGITMGHLEGLPLRSTATGCAYQGLLSLSSLFWIPGLVYEPILFVLVAYKAWDPFGRQPTLPLVKRIARDSLMYFVAVFAELLVSTIIWAHAPQYINIVNPWSAALPSLLGSRLMLNMREAVFNNGSTNTYIIETFTDASPDITYARQGNDEENEMNEIS
ncbi:uncharacterized protein PHACADRAFT_205002 [Phanerochaete carnosa HHB-10118-sp]|uniref:DUF6533 domain-containing protein n=1 Tax=Phanerochaete carnosa (strain HHB-10118-sp) TaxID=650164 RepID=K5XFM0_PHACS|nr:uncharacterized protein PHACADRAFT_205002 [Phanerochaete carnosa HHB-10118-sp]EKM61872.1 hypothetical protein PHACADRAFT_205002 [Phanerochaete carnosa HHB-10118-sp]